MTLSFGEYKQKRNEAFEFLSKAKNKAKELIGLQDEKGKSSLDKHAMVQAAQAGKDAATNIGGVAANSLNVAANVATGNIVGAAFSIWDWIKSVTGAGAGLKSLASAGTLVAKIKQHKTGLTKFLTERGVSPQTVQKIVDAVFEIDVNAVEEIPPTVWGVTTTEFMKTLATGYDNIEQKIFASVVYQQLLVWLRKYAGHAEGLEDAVRELLKERQEKLAVVSSPKVKELIAQFQPDGEMPAEKKKVPTKPEVGDKAYTRYGGTTYVGTLQQMQHSTHMYLLPDGKKAPYHSHGGIHVGYDEPIEWDAKAGMWKAPADYD